MDLEPESVTGFKWRTPMVQAFGEVVGDPPPLTPGRIFPYYTVHSENGGRGVKLNWRTLLPTSGALRGGRSPPPPRCGEAPAGPSIPYSLRRLPNPYPRPPNPWSACPNTYPRPPDPWSGHPALFAHAPTRPIRNSKSCQGITNQ